MPRLHLALFLLIAVLATACSPGTPSPDAAHDALLQGAVTGVVQWARDRAVQYRDLNFQVVAQREQDAVVQVSIIAQSPDTPGEGQELVAWMRMAKTEDGWTINPNAITFMPPDVLSTTLRPDQRLWFWYNRGIVAEKAQDWSKAVDALARVVAQKPDYEDARARLTQIREQLSATAELLLLSNRTGKFQLWVATAGGENPFLLTQPGTEDWLGDWSPDGERIVFSSQRGENDWQIYVISDHGTDKAQLTEIPGRNIDASWSPDGKWILFSSNRDGDPDLYALLAPGLGPTEVISQAIQLTNDPGQDTEGAWSPDGKWILFTSDREGQRDLYVMAAPTAGGTVSQDRPVRLTLGEAGEWAGTWSPDGKWVLYTTDVNGNWDVYMMPAPVEGRAAGGRPVNVTASPNSHEWHPVWAPDGALFAFATDRDGNVETYVQAALGRGGPETARNVTQHPQDDWPSAWRAKP